VTTVAEKLGITEPSAATSAAWEFALAYDRRGRSKRIPSAVEVIVMTLMDRIRELEAENVALRGLR